MLYLHRRCNLFHVQNSVCTDGDYVNFAACTDGANRSINIETFAPAVQIGLLT